jgi:hypothetical protein
MKVEVTHASIVNDMGVVATVQLVDENVVQVNIKQITGWNDWLNLTDAVRRVMLLMEVKND